MRGAETSTSMLPSRRGAYLHNSTSFETILEKNKKNHKHDAEIDPTTIESSIQQNKKMRMNIEENHPKYSNFSDLGSHVGRICPVV